MMRWRSGIGRSKNASGLTNPKRVSVCARASMRDRASGVRGVIRRPLRRVTTWRLCLVYLRLGKYLNSHQADAVVEGVGDVEVAGLVHGRAERVVQAARVGGPAIPGELRGPVAGDQGDDLRLRIPLADQVIVGIRDVEGPIGGERDAGRPGQARRELVGHPLIAILRPVAGDRADGPRGQVYLADAPRESVRDVESALGVQGQSARTGQSGVHGLVPVAVVLPLAVARIGRDPSRVEVPYPDAIVRQVGDVE